MQCPHFEKEFATIKGLLHAYIAYCPRTISCDGHGGKVDEDVLEENVEIIYEDNKEADIEEMIIPQQSNVVSHFKHFAYNLLAVSVNPTETDDGSEIDAVVFEEKVSGTITRLQKKRKANNVAIFTVFTKLSKCDKIEDLFDDILEVSTTIDLLDDKSERGLISHSRKNKKLIGK